MRGLSIILLLTILLLGITAELYDYAPQTAPLLGTKLNFTAANFDVRGKTVTIFDKLPPNPAPQFGPARLIIRAATKEIYWQVGDNYWVYVNETIGLNLFNDPALICGKVTGYNWDNYIADFADYLKLSSSKIISAKDMLFSELAANLTTPFTPLQQFFLRDIVDDYYVYGSDIGTGSRNGTGCQPLPFSGLMSVSRVYSNVPIRLSYGQYFPGLQNVSSDNSLRGLINFDNWKPVNITLNLYELIPEAVRNACAAPIDYCTQLYNTDVWRAQLV